MRSGIMLEALYPNCLDLQRLVYLDYLLVHSGDVKGPPSLHPASPMRTGEVVVRRGLVERGLALLCAKGLALRSASSDGIVYAGSEHLGAFLGALNSQYVASLRAVALWVAASFGDAEFVELQATLGRVTDAWSVEFDVAEDRDA